MNIWYLSAHDQPRGRSSRTYDFAKSLLRLGHQVTMLTNSICHWTHEDYLGENEKWRIEDVDGIRVVWLKTTPYKGNGIQRGINMLSNVRRSLQVSNVLVDRPDVVIGPSVPLGTGWAASHIAQKMGSAFVFEVRDVWPIALVDDGSLSTLNPVYHIFRWLEKKLYRNACLISSTLPLLSEHVAKSGANPDKVFWIPNGVDFDRFQCASKPQPVSSNGFVVMYVGGFGAAHDVMTIVRAAKILQDRGEARVLFDIIGDGVNKPQCQKMAVDNQLKNIRFKGSVKKSEVPIIQSQADILVASVVDSQIYHRFGINLNKIYDYFASAKPVLFSGVTKNDPVQEAGAGFSIAPEDPVAMADTIMKLMEMGQDARRAMGKKGRLYVEKNFDMSVLGKRMEFILEESINNKKG